MISFQPYSHTPNRLEDYLPWAMLVAPGVVLNKDGSFQTTARFRGPDVRSSTPEELVSFTARANNVFRRLGRGWAAYIEADRREITDYPHGAFNDDLSRLIDSERAAEFEQAGAQFETVHHLTLQWMPDSDSSRKASAFFFELDQKKKVAEPKTPAVAVKPSHKDRNNTRSVRLSKVGSVSMNSTIRFVAKALDEFLCADEFFCFSNRFWSVQPHCVPQFHPARPAT